MPNHENTKHTKRRSTFRPSRSTGRREPGRERAELVRALSLRFVELRKQAGMRQQDVAEAMAREKSGARLVRRLEHGGVANATVCSVADFLRAVRAGFSSLRPALDRYTSTPIPRRARRLAEAAARPRAPVVRPALAWTGPRAALPLLPADMQSDAEVRRVRRRAGYWVLRRFLELYMHNTFDSVGVPGWLWVRRRMARYGRRVFGTLFFTRGPKEKARPERLERLRRSAGKLQLTTEVAELMEAVVTNLFEKMQAENELDWQPEPDQAFEIMARKPKQRVVTDLQMCLAEWNRNWGRYAAAVAEVDREGREAAEKLLQARCAAPNLLGHYRLAANWATRIGADTAPGTPQREKSLKEFARWSFPPRLDRALLDRLLRTVLEVWDSARPGLPPSPGPMPR